MSDEENLKEMTEKEYAFPVAFPAYDKMYVCPGMEMRDWFAGQALASGYIRGEFDTSEAWRAQCCYKMADAMLEARKK